MTQSERKGLVERLKLGLRMHEDSTHWLIKECDADMRAAADLLSSDARPAPMAEEVKNALTAVAMGFTSHLPKAHDTLAAHIDDLTRKVAEAEAAVKIVWPFFEGEHSYDHPDSVRVRALLASVRPKQEGV